jgi:hypothetical protein
MAILMHRQGVPIGYIAITLALVASMGGFIFGVRYFDVLLSRGFSPQLVV